VRTTRCLRRSRTGQPSARLDRGERADPCKGGANIVVVRLLLFIALAAIGVAVLLWFVTRNRRYLRFILLTLEFTLILLLAILLWFAAERLFAPMMGHLL
jgi:hypothetical protein